MHNHFLLKRFFTKKSSFFCKIIYYKQCSDPNSFFPIHFSCPQKCPLYSITILRNTHRVQCWWKRQFVVLCSLVPRKPFCFSIRIYVTKRFQTFSRIIIYCLGNLVYVCPSNSYSFNLFPNGTNITDIAIPKVRKEKTSYITWLKRRKWVGGTKSHSAAIFHIKNKRRSR